MQLYLAIINFIHLYGQTVPVQTDHKSLITLFTEPLHSIPVRLQRMMLKLQSYGLNLTFVPSKLLIIAVTIKIIKYVYFMHYKLIFSIPSSYVKINAYKTSYYFQFFFFSSSDFYTVFSIKRCNV